ncbi:hypothetical protein SLA2020_150520 [Shorea laevis]
MSEVDEQITKAFKARRTALQMLRDRGYSVEDAEIKMTRQQFVERFVVNGQLKREDLLIESSKGDGPYNQICVFFPDGPKVGVPVVRSYVGKMKDKNAFNAILVVQMPLTAPAKGAIAEVNTNFGLEVFEEAELLSNITEHIFVPKHAVLTSEEKKKLLADYRIKETQLPRILVNDPVAKYYGLKRGQVMRIIRESATADTYVTYRYAV